MFQELSVPGMGALTLEQTKKQLRAVLLSSKGKGGVALDLLEIEYFNLVCIFNLLFLSIQHSVNNLLGWRKPGKPDESSRFLHCRRVPGWSP